MHPGARILSLRSLLLTVAATGVALAQSGVTGASPFVPAKNGAVAPAPPADRLELVAVLSTGTSISVRLYDPSAKTSLWIPVGGQAGGIAVVSYQPGSDRAVVKVGGVQRTLVLRPTRVQNGAAPAPAAGVAVAAPKPAYASEAAVAAAPVFTPAVAGAASAGAKPEPPPIPADVAKKQEDARMLVSDLLEIGLAQRQAYEAAKKQASPAAPEPSRTSPSNASK